MKTIIIVNVTSYTDIGALGAEHFYAKTWTMDTDKNVYYLAENLNTIGIWDKDKERLMRKIDATEAKYLNKKDGRGSGWKAGDETERFNSLEQVRETVSKLYPENDIIVLRANEFEQEHLNVICRTTEEYKKTGRKIEIRGFQGFSREFVNLKEGSIHEVIETPKRYEHKVLQSGVWVMGVTEPVLVLTREYINVDQVKHEVGEKGSFSNVK